MAATNASKKAAEAKKQTAYQALMAGATKKDYLDVAKATDEVAPTPPQVQATSAPVATPPPAVRKVEPIVERATPATMPLSVATQARGASEGTVMVRMANGRIKPMASGVALKMQTNYPNEFKIVS